MNEKGKNIEFDLEKYIQDELNEEDLAIWNAQKAEAAMENDNYTVISQNKSSVYKSNIDAGSALS